MLKRTVTGLVAGAYVVAMVLLGKTALLINVVLLLLIGTHEMLSSLSAGGFRPVKWVYYPYVLLLVPAYLWLGEKGLLILLIAGAMAAMAAAALRHEPDPGELMAALLPAFYPAIPIMAMCIVMNNTLDHWRLYVWLMFALSVGSDGFALFFGRAFGRHKLIPKVSPNKTVEGAVGGVVGALFSALIIYLVSLYYHDGVSVWTFFMLGLVGSVVTQVGDIVASYIKRFCKVKDFGKIFPGHGGLLDRLDGIMYNAVALCIYTMLLSI
jgi:phosphatidate cytidylyltransferase